MWRAPLRASWQLHARVSSLNSISQHADLSSVSSRSKAVSDPRLHEENLIEDRFARVKDRYGSNLHPVDTESKAKTTLDAPKNPIVLAHGLFGFDELHLLGTQLPSIQYWRGITEALSARNVEVITATVPPSGCIEARAEKLAECVSQKACGKSVNIIG